MSAPMAGQSSSNYFRGFSGMYFLMTLLAFILYVFAIIGLPIAMLWKIRSGRTMRREGVTLISLIIVGIFTVAWGRFHLSAHLDIFLHKAHYLKCADEATSIGNYRMAVCKREGVINNEWINFIVYDSSGEIMLPADRRGRAWKECASIALKSIPFDIESAAAYKISNGFYLLAFDAGAP